jgi:hypothetical protein
MLYFFSCTTDYLSPLFTFISIIVWLNVTNLGYDSHSFVRLLLLNKASKTICIRASVNAKNGILISARLLSESEGRIKVQSNLCIINFTVQKCAVKKWPTKGRYYCKKVLNSKRNLFYDREFWISLEN